MMLRRLTFYFSASAIIRSNGGLWRKYLKVCWHLYPLQLPSMFSADKQIAKSDGDMVNTSPVEHHHVPTVLVSLVTPGNVVMLAFRPEFFPAWKPDHLSSSTSKQITLSPDARNTAWVSFDGRKRQEIQYGDWYVSLSSSAAVSFCRFSSPRP